MSALRPALLATILALGLPVGASQPAGRPTEAPGAAPAPARQLLEQAKSKAKASGKGLLVGFHASWCGYCRKLQGILAQPSVKEVLDRRFVVTWVTVLERPGKEALENPGGKELFLEWSGGDTGIPFLATFDSSGRLVATSLRAGRDGNPANIGLPARPPEVAHFVAMLRSASPSLTDAEAAAVAAAFSKPS